MSIFHLSIRSSDTEFPYEGRYLSTLTLKSFKDKLQMIVGIPSSGMRLHLYDTTGTLIRTLDDAETSTLSELGVEDKFTIKVEDVSGNTPSSNANNPDISERYKMDDQKYDSRGDSVRKWMKELGVDKFSESIPDYIKVGNRCVVRLANQPERLGRIAFVGTTHFKPGKWVGVIYDDPVGKNDGSIDGHRYFTCEPMHGGFVSPKFVHHQIDTNEHRIEENLEEI